MDICSTPHLEQTFKILEQKPYISETQQISQMEWVSYPKTNNLPDLSDQMYFLPSPEQFSLLQYKAELVSQIESVTQDIPVYFIKESSSVSLDNHVEENEEESKRLIPEPQSTENTECSKNREIPSTKSAAGHNSRPLVVKERRSSQKRQHKTAGINKLIFESSFSVIAQCPYLCGAFRTGVRARSNIATHIKRCEFRTAEDAESKPIISVYTHMATS